LLLAGEQAFRFHKIQILLCPNIRLRHNGHPENSSGKQMNEIESGREDRHWTILIVSMTASAGLAIMLGQDAGFDLLNYHYYSGFALLHKAFGYDFAPAQIQSFHNPLLHLISYLTLAHLSAKSAALLLGAVQGLNFYLVFRISQVLFPEFNKIYRYLLGLTCAGAGYFGIASKTELGATYGDNMVSILVLAGLLLVLRRLQTGWISGKKATAVFAAAGLLVGAAVGLKFTSAVYLLGMLLALPLSLLKTQHWRRIAMVFACGTAIGFLAAYGFWGTNLYLSYQNPFFPYLNKTFHSPYFDSSNFVDERFFPRTWQQTLFYVFFFAQRNQLASEIEFRDIRLALCYTAIVLLSIIGLIRLTRGRRSATAAVPSRDRCLLFLGIFFAISYIGWLRLSSIYRYLSVLELLAPVFLALAINKFIKSKSTVFWWSLVLNLVIAEAALPISFGRTEFANDLLKLEIPRVRELDQSVILMTAYEATSYIVPSFPEKTRFVRISSTFVTPGRNHFLDTEIRERLSRYDRRHTFAYVQNAQEIGLARLDASAYEINIDAHSCFEIRSLERKQNRGYLCGVAGETAHTEEMPAPELRYSPKFLKMEHVKFSGSVDHDYINARIEGIRSGSVDILYELDGEMMPPIRTLRLNFSTILNLGPLSRSGDYRIIGIRDSAGSEPDMWIPFDAKFRINK
jgi:hypothetical protein